ncbi:MAG: hypothetical protein ACKVT2_00600 [Saprospiraceae bacterium]
MHLRISLFVFAIALIPGVSFAQKKAKPEPAIYPDEAAIQQLQGLEDTLGVLGYAIVNDSVEAERFAACRVFITTLVRALKIENSFKFPFEQLRTVSILTPPDSSFRIFTWQLFVNDSTYRYYGSIQMNERHLKMYPLIDRSFEMPVFPSNESLRHDRWYGALYFNLRQFDTRQGRKYLLFGFDAFEFFEKRKLMDVLSFDKEGTPFFGAPVFEKEQSAPEHRIYVQYSADAKVKMNWDEQYQMIVFDHLIPFPSPFGRDMTQVPDGSYDGYKFEKGKWRFVDKVFDDKQKDVPFPEPILDGRKGNDILGKKKKNKS